MKVSTRVHYGLQAMTELARTYGDQRLLSLSEIARDEDLPLAYLEQLVGELRRAGLVEGTRTEGIGCRRGEGVGILYNPLPAHFELRSTRQSPRDG